MLLKRFLDDENGATAIEYALIGTLISLAIISGMTGIADQVQRMFTEVQESFEP